MGAESHTADQRLGIIVGPDNPVAFTAPVLSRSQSQSPEGPGEDLLDRDTTLSRSFRSSQFQSLPGSHTGSQELGTSQLKLSQVRVLTSPPPSQPDHLLTSASRTPANSRLNSKRKTLQSNISRKSLKSALGSGRAAFRRNGVQHGASPPVTTETNLDTETEQDEEVFLSSSKRARYPNIVEQVGGQTGGQDGGEMLRRGSSAASDWRDPRKGRRVGSPGRTGKAEYFTRQAPLPSVSISLADRPRTEFVARQRAPDRRSVASAGAVGGARPKTSGQHLRPPALRRKPQQKYSGHSESDLTDFTSDEETRRQVASRRLELPSRDLSPLSSCGDVSVTPPPPASTDVSPDPSILAQYSIVAFTQSDMELVDSSQAK